MLSRFSSTRELWWYRIKKEQSIAGKNCQQFFDEEGCNIYREEVYIYIYMFCFVFFNKITFYGRVIEVQDDDKGQQQEFSKNGGGGKRPSMVAQYMSHHWPLNFRMSSGCHPRPPPQISAV